MELEEWREAAHRFALVGGAVRAGLVDAANGRTAREVAEEVEGDPRATRIALDGLAAIGVLERDGERYRRTPEGESLLPGGGNRFTALHGLETLESWLTLPEVIRTGAPVESGERYDGGWEVFIGAMAEKGAEFAEGAVSACLEEKPDAETVLDVGGGAGLLSREFASRGLDVTMLDRGRAIELYREELEGEVGLVTGDFTEDLPSGPFDLVYLGNVTHIYGPEENRRLFERVFGALAPGGLVAVNDYVRGVSSRAALFGVNMLVNTERGDTWTRDRFETWLTDAGFVDVRVRTLDPNDSQLVLAERPGRS